MSVQAVQGLAHEFLEACMLYEVMIGVRGYSESRKDRDIHLVVHLAQAGALPANYGCILLPYLLKP